MPENASTITVNVSPAPYPVCVQPGLMHAIGARLRELTQTRRVVVLTDSNVATLHLERLHRSLKSADFEVITATVPAGEEHKHLRTLLHVYDTFLNAKIERTTPVIALGGGVIGDMAGFVAATILRGVPFVQVPTTLLAMVDASTGGKTGVDAAAGKNLIGSFHQPIAVLIDPEVLRTLPPRELRGGLAECIKHDIIRDGEHFSVLEKSISRALDLDMNFLSELIAHNVAIKARVVEADPFEKGERAHLNFGHTFGHAIEHVSNYSYSHGESVALGMAAAAHLAADLKMIDVVSRDRVLNLIQRAGLPTSGLKLDPKAIVNAMAFDKKVKSGKVRLILPDRIGNVVIRDDISHDSMQRAVEKLR